MFLHENDDDGRRRQRDQLAARAREAENQVETNTTIRQFSQTRILTRISSIAIAFAFKKMLFGSIEIISFCGTFEEFSGQTKQLRVT